MRGALASYPLSAYGVMRLFKLKVARCRHIVPGITFAIHETYSTFVPVTVPTLQSF